MKILPIKELEKNNWSSHIVYGEKEPPQKVVEEMDKLADILTKFLNRKENDIQQ